MQTKESVAKSGARTTHQDSNKVDAPRRGTAEGSPSQTQTRTHSRHQRTRKPHKSGHKCMHM
eukprot:EC814048.1.p5 GENE.EC814048.1~~EC814048.1.p5  ORF type:complete len:62 (+),score=2.35 EC814048.1:271-456(+)